MTVCYTSGLQQPVAPTSSLFVFEFSPAKLFILTNTLSGECLFYLHTRMLPFLHSGSPEIPGKKSNTFLYDVSAEPTCRKRL